MSGLRVVEGSVGDFRGEEQKRATCHDSPSESDVFARRLGHSYNPFAQTCKRFYNDNVAKRFGPLLFTCKHHAPAEPWATNVSRLRALERFQVSCETWHWMPFFLTLAGANKTVVDTWLLRKRVVNR